MTDRMTSQALSKAKLEVWQVCQTGQTITLLKPLTKDELGEAKTDTETDLKVHPIRKSPFSRSITNKIAWADQVDIIFYIAKKQVDDYNLTADQLKRYKNVRVDGKRYDINYADNYSSFKDDYLYVLVGCKHG